MPMAQARAGLGMDSHVVVPFLILIDAPWARRTVYLHCQT